jgi:hypothetical protein
VNTAILETEDEVSMCLTIKDGKTCMGSGGIIPCILNNGTRWR